MGIYWFLQSRILLKCNFMKYPLFSLFLWGAFFLIPFNFFSQDLGLNADGYIPYFKSAKIVLDGVGKSSFCYRSRKGEILYLYKFEVRNIYKGNGIVKLGDIYLVQGGISGTTQDGSNVDVLVADGDEPLNASGINVFITARVLSDTSRLPTGFYSTASNKVFLIPQIVVNTVTKDQARKNFWQGANLGNSYFPTVDSLYSYLNYNLGFIPKNEYEPKVKNEPIKIEDKTIYGISQLTTHPHFPGGKDSLSSYVIANINRKLIPQSDIDSHRHMRFGFLVQTSADGDVEAVNFENGFSREFNEEFIRVIKSGPKFIPGLINGKPVKARITYFVDLKF